MTVHHYLRRMALLGVASSLMLTHFTACSDSSDSSEDDETGTVAESDNASQEGESESEGEEAGESTESESPTEGSGGMESTESESASAEESSAQEGESASEDEDDSTAEATSPFSPEDVETSEEAEPTSPFMRPAADGGAPFQMDEGPDLPEEVQAALDALVECTEDSECEDSCAEESSCVCGTFRGGMGGGQQATGVCRTECETDDDCDGTTCNNNGVCSLLEGGNQFQQQQDGDAGTFGGRNGAGGPGAGN